jgi:hypothetical protein
MKTSAFMCFGIIPLIILTGCGKETQVSGNGVDNNLQTEHLKVIPPSPLNIKPEANIVFTKMRKTKLEIDDRGNIQNFEQYMRDFNKRKIIAINDGRFLDNGTLRCRDLTDPTNVIENKVGFINDGTIAEMEIKLSESLSVTSEHKYNCSVYENNNFLDQSNSGDLIFYNDVAISTSKKYNEVGFTTGHINKVGALVFLADSALVTDGKKLEISAEELIARSNSQIKTFLNNNATAQADQPGINGGFIDIKTKFITGNLHVEMSGQNGGEVTTTPNKILSIPSNYSDGLLDGAIETGHIEKITISRSGPGTTIERYAIDVKPTSGLDGFAGTKGINGLAGLSGGDSGIFKLTTSSSNSFTLNTNFLPGSGSYGGAGGQGGPGSPGGKIHCGSQKSGRFNNDYHSSDEYLGKVFHMRTYCEMHTEILPGNTGSTGSVGDRGVKGNDGKVQYGQFINLSSPEKNRDFHSENQDY